RREEREEYCDQPPHRREALRRQQIVRVVGCRVYEVPVDIDRGGRRKSIQLCRLGGKRGGEERRDQQAYQAMRQVIQDERDKYVIGVACSLLRIDGRCRLLAKCIDLRLSDGRGGPRLSFRLRISTMPSFNPCVQVLLLLLVRCRKTFLQFFEFSAITMRDLIVPCHSIEVYRRLVELIKNKQ